MTLKPTSQPTSSGAKNTTEPLPQTFSELASQMNWGAAAAPSKQGREKYFAGTVPDKRPSDQDLEMLAEMMRGRQRLP